jgi:hypothetical protein
LNWTHINRDLLQESRAAFSPCGTYRYGLIREWNPGKRPLLFVMLNPSTADHLANDPTVARCQRRAITGGWGGVAVANLFALRSTYPSALYEHPDPIGPENDAAILELATAAGRVVCAWGDHGQLGDRAAAVVAMLRAEGVSLGFLRMTQKGEPAHPCRLGYAVEWKPWPDDGVVHPARASAHSKPGKISAIFAGIGMNAAIGTSAGQGNPGDLSRNEQPPREAGCSASPSGRDQADRARAGEEAAEAGEACEGEREPVAARRAAGPSEDPTRGGQSGGQP